MSTEGDEVATSPEVVEDVIVAVTQRNKVEAALRRQEALIEASETPKFEHIRCEPISLDSTDLNTQAKTSVDDSLNNRDGLHGEDRIDITPGDSDKSLLTEEKDTERDSGTEIIESFTDDSPGKSSDASSLRSSFKESTEKSSSHENDIRDVELQGAALEDHMRRALLEVAHCDSGSSQETPAENLSPKKEKEKGFSFFGNLRKKATKPAVKEEAVTVKKEPNILERTMSKTSFFGFVSSESLQTTTKPAKPETPESSENEKPDLKKLDLSENKCPDTGKVTTPQDESPTKGFFSLSGVLKRRSKKPDDVKTPDSDGGQSRSDSKDSKPPRPPPPKHSKTPTDDEDGFLDNDPGVKDMDNAESIVDDFGADSSDNGPKIDDDDGNEYQDYEDIGAPEGDRASMDSVSICDDELGTKETKKKRMFSLPQYFKRMSKTNDQSKKLKTQIWSSVVTIVLIEGKNLLAMDDNGLSDPYVKFRLGNERYKSKYKPKTLNPKWLEQFDLHMFDDQTSHLEISVWDHDTGGRDDIMGRIEMDLSSLEPEVTHTMDLPLEDGAGTIHMLLTISGTSGSETVSDIANFSPNPLEREKTVRKYGVINSFKGIKDIGWLQVKVIKAQGVAAADLGGKSDPFCVLELINSRLQTQTEYKTLNPEWGKVFTFNVKDVHSVLEVSVYDEDRDKKSEFLGKVSVPLLRLKNGEKKWWTLKDKKQLLRTKGAILLETDLIYNHFKAAIRTVNPREDKYMQPDAKFKLNVMKRNIDRVTKIAQAGVESGKFLQSCFDWESKIRSIIAFAVYLIIVWNFELYMLPLTLLIVFLKNLLVIQVVGNLMKDKEDDTYVDEDDDDDDDDKEAKKEEKKSFKEKLQAIQDVCLQVQEGMDMAASMGERVKNTFNWTVPWLSWLAVILLTIGVVVLYNLPLRILLMAWGINKFTKKLRAPNAIPNNELLDYLSRVPSDKELIMYRELRPDPAIGCTKKKRS